MAAAVDRRPVVFLLELDAIGSSGCIRKVGSLPLWEADLRYEIDAVAALPHTVVYVEGGYSDANTPAYTARVLNAVGIGRIRGFYTNDTHLNWTIDEVRWGDQGLATDRRRPLHRQHGPERPRTAAQPAPDDPGQRGSLQPARARARARSRRPTPASRSSTRSCGRSPPGNSSGCNGGPPGGVVLAGARDRGSRSARTTASDRATRASRTEPPAQQLAAISRAASGRASAADARRHRRQPAAVGEQPPDLVAPAGRPVSSLSGITIAAPALLHEARVRRLVVGGRVRIRDQHRRPAVRGDLEDRAAGARHDQIAGQQRLAEVGDVAAQVVVRSPGAGPRARARSRSPAACRTRKRAPANAVDRRLVDRPRALRAAEHEHARLVAARSRSGPARRRQSVAGAGTGRPVTHVAGAVATLDRKRQAHAPRERRQQPVGQPEMAVGLDQHERDSRDDRGQPDRPGDVAAGAEDRRRPQPRDRSARASTHRAGRRSAPRRAAATGRAARQRRDAQRAQLVAGGRDELDARRARRRRT